MTLPVAILAGGLATRLGALTAETPKALIEVAGRPFIEHQLAWLAHQGVARCVLLVGYRGEAIRAAVGDGGRWGMTVEYAVDGDRLLGTGGAVRRARDVIGTRFFIMYGDSYLDCDLVAVERAFDASGCTGLMTVLRNDDKWDASNVLFEDGRIAAYDKTRRTAGMRHIDYGLGVLDARALEPYPAATPFDLATVYQDLLAAGELAAFEVTSRFYEIGSPEGLAETRAHLERHGAPGARPQPGA